MLEGLDHIDWSSLQHAYGLASDVPGQIRALASDDPVEREHALDDLFGNIWHQGTVYEASAHAVPFLIELAREPSIQDKVGILNLLGCLAEGSSYLDVHALREKEEAHSGCGDPDFEEALSQELDWAQETHDAVEKGIQVYLDLLSDEDWQTRLAAAKALATCTGRLDIAATSLLESFERETDPRVHFGLLLCLGDVGQERDVAFLKAIVGTEPEPNLLRDPEEELPSPGFLRGAAAVALTQILKVDTPVEAVRILRETIDNPEPMDEFLEEMPWAPPDAIELSSSVLCLVGPERAIPVLIQLLRTVPKSRVNSIVGRLVDLAFPEINEYTARNPHPRRTDSSLSPLQSQVLGALVARDEAWQPPCSLDFSLKRLGLPERRQDLRAFLRDSSG